MLTTPRYRVPPDPDQLLAAFPQRLKALRTARHLSLHELAQRAGVTKAFLSLLERGVNAPSAASLEALAAALNVPVSALFPDEAATPLRVSFVRQAERVAERGHAYTTLNLLHPLFLHSEFHPFVIVCERSSFTPQEVSIVGEQFVFMLSGSLDYFYDDVLYTLRPGDALYFNALVPHGPRTLHTGHAEYLTCFVTEAYAWFDMRLHFRGGSPLPPHLPSSRPLPQRLARKLRLVRLNRFELLETVSARAGLKVSTLAALEQGQVNPSAATLLRLAHAFNLPLQYFLDPTDYPHQACFTPVEARARAAVTSTQGNYRYALAQPLGAPLFFMPELHIYHRRAHLPPLATSPGQFFVFIIDGTCEFRCGDALFTLQPGDALTGYSRDPHGLTRLLTSHVSLLHITSDLAGMLATALEHMR